MPQKEVYVPLTKKDDIYSHLAVRKQEYGSSPFPPKELDQIDFEREIGLLLTRGVKPTGFFTLEVSKIEAEKQNIYVRIVTTDPLGAAPAMVEFKMTLLKVAKEYLPKGKANFIFIDPSGKIHNQVEIEI